MRLAIASLLAALATAQGTEGAAEARHFSFAEPASVADYSDARGAGFEPGFPVRAAAGGVGNDAAFFFSVALPEGNWRVTVRLGGAAGGSCTTVKAELRRLFVEAQPVSEGGEVARTFIVNVRRPVIPAVRGVAAGRVRLKAPRETTQEAWAWDDRLTLEFGGTRPVVRAIEVEPADVPTIYLLGDSTVCDQSREPYTSWGQMLTRFLGPEVAVASHAESGESYRDSLRERRLDKVLTLLRPGDWVLMQFGHNDQKQVAAGTGGPFTTYQAEIRQYVAAVRAAGAIPVVIAPMERREFGPDGRIKPSLADYAEAARTVARELGVDCLDLHALSLPFYEALGPVRSAAAFAAPNGVVDNTHHSAYGAYELARCVALAARTQRLGFARYLTPETGVFDPSHPDAPESLAVPASPLVTSVRPLGD